MSSADEVRLDPETVAGLYLRHADELRYFVLGLVRSSDLAADVLQVTFAKAVEQGHKVEEASLKSWLFKVAYNEVQLHWRRQAVGDKAARRLAEQDTPGEEPAEVHLGRVETVLAVREALDKLPAEQREVVRMRVYEQMKFADIAQELDLPLGTVLSRMHTALKKLRGKLNRLND